VRFIALAGRARSRARDDGFTLIEVTIAGLVLIIGMLGVVSMLSGSVRATTVNNERVGATNLARELVEGVRSLDYGDMSGQLVRDRLQARGLGSGTPWTIERRNVTYTVTATSCTFDSPTDKLAATPPAGVCTPQPTGATGDSNGEDFRRTTFNVAWHGANGNKSVTQTTLVVNPSGGLGPRVSGVSPATQTITGSATTASVTWTTGLADTLRWAIDDGASSGSVSGGAAGSTSFVTSWAIGSSGSGSEILDGSYQITAQPFDDRDIAGDVKRANIILNRRRPYAPATFAGGHNTRSGDIVDLEWARNRERDVLGYRVVWTGPDATAGNADDKQVCPVPTDAELLTPTTTSCADFDPPNGGATYYVAAVDRASDNALREGDRRSLTIPGAGSRPNPPLGLVVLTVNGQPTVTWLPPLLSSVSFYRIYRDGVRYDRAPAGTLTYTDTSPGSVGHSYYVTAVNSSYNESNALGPVLWVQ
jgi:Tfp pilus assembly protein PilV